MAHALRATSTAGGYSLLFGLAAAVALCDQTLKYLVSHNLSGGRYIDVAGGLVRIDFTQNTGAAFGMYRTGGFALAAIAVAVCAGIIVFRRRIAASAPIVRAAIGLILGGAVGNLIDRVRLGYVIDFVDLRWWPVFNLADSAIVIGVALLFLWSLVEGREREAAR